MIARALASFAESVTRAHDREALPRVALECVLTVTNAERGGVMLVDESNVLRFSAWTALSEAYRKAVEAAPPWSAGDADPQPLIVPDVRARLAPDTATRIVLSDEIRGVAWIPVVARSTLVGAIVVGHDTPRDLAEEACDALTVTARLLAFALERRETDTTSRAKDECLAMLAHELRNPLGAIVNAVAVLDRMSSQEAAPIATRALIRRQTDQLTRLLDDLLDVSRLTRNLVTLRTRPVDLRSVAAAAVDAERHRIEANHQRLRVSVSGGDLTCDGDASRLRQVIGNLVSNASKYTPAGGSITIELFADGADVVCVIRDTGAGIPSDRSEWIFEPFTQLRATQANRGGGVGLGLTVVKRVVALHGGTIRVRSDGPDRGTEFTVRLPRATSQPDPVRDEDDPRSTTHAGVCRVLVIDGNADARDTLAQVLRLYGHHVVEAATGRDGIEAATQHRPDLVLVEIDLPDTDGFMVARRLREKLGDAVLLVAATGHGQPEDRRRSVAAGFREHLVKPVTLRDVVEVLRSGVPRTPET